MITQANKIAAPPAVAVQRLVRRLQPQDPYDHASNTEIPLMKAALNKAGYDASNEDIQWAWEQHSEDSAAGWLVLASCGDADGAVKYLLGYLMPESPNCD